jgi:3-methyladenine DNA glycosylase AlkD
MTDAGPPIENFRTMKHTDVAAVIEQLRKKASPKVRAGMARYAIPSDHALGIGFGDLKRLAKRLGKNHALASDLWATGIYEARTLATMIDDPALVTPAQMDRWCREFDNWAICDSACFVLFDKTPHAWKKVDTWARSPREFVKRASFALLASLTVHDKAAGDQQFASRLPLIAAAANDDRHFVKKAVNWALRSIGKRSPALHAAAKATAQELAESENLAARWIGKDALRDLASPATLRRLQKQKK